MPALMSLSVRELDKIVNLTPHELTILDEDNTVLLRVQPSGTIARLTETRMPTEWITTKGQEGNYCPPFLVENVSYSKTEGLPETKAGVRYFVSLMILQANPERLDLIAPGKQVRDENGRIIGLYTVQSNNTI